MFCFASSSILEQHDSPSLGPVFIAEQAGRQCAGQPDRVSGRLIDTARDDGVSGYRENVKLSVK